MMKGKRNRIILDCDLMRHPHSGLYHYCLNLGNYVNRHLLQSGREGLSFYVPAHETGSFEDPGRCIIEKKWHHRYFSPFLWDCAVWHAPFQSGRILPMKNKKIKILLTIHDLNCLHEDKSARERRQSLEHTQTLIDRADAIVCISGHCKKDVQENMDTGDKPVYVIYNGTHQVGIPPATPAGYRPSRPFLFAMGYVNRKKNFHTLIPLLCDNDIDLVVAGRLDEPDYVEAMKEQARTMGVQDRLHLTGPVPEADKAWYFRHCQAFSLPSLAEGFGAPVVEAMLFGKPLFLSALTSLPEIGGDAAFYFRNFEPGHMQEVYRQGLEKAAQPGYAEYVRQRGQTFRWEEKAAEYAEVYLSLLSST